MLAPPFNIYCALLRCQQIVPLSTRSAAQVVGLSGVGAPGIAICLVPVMIQAPTFGTFEVGRSFISRSDGGPANRQQDIDITLGFDHVRCSNLGVVAYAVINNVSVTLDIEQPMAVCAKTPVGFLPVQEITRPGIWHMGNPAVGVTRGCMLSACLAIGNGCAVGKEQTSALAACMPAKLYAFHDLSPFLVCDVIVSEDLLTYGYAMVKAVPILHQ